MKFDTLWEGEFISVISPKDHPYEAILEEDTCLILPIKEGKVGIRKELCPPYLVKNKTGEKKYYTVISGGREEGEDWRDTALRELKEEAGILVRKGKLYRLFQDIPMTKLEAKHTALILLLIEEFEKEKMEGDGTIYEDKSETLWVNLEELGKILLKPNIDSLLFFCGFILKQIMKSLNSKVSWQEQKAPYINNQSEIDYWDNYIDEDPWTDDAKNVEDLVMSAEITFKKYEENAISEDRISMKTNFYYEVLPLAISYLKLKGKINMGVLEAMIMQNI